MSIKGKRFVLYGTLSKEGKFEYGQTSVVTLVDKISDTMGLVRYGSYEGKDLFAGVELVKLGEIENKYSEEQLNSEVDYKELVSVNYHKGKRFIVGPGIGLGPIKTGDVGEIIEVTVKFNENDDKFKVQFGEHVVILDKKFLDMYCEPHVEELEKVEEVDLSGVKNYFLIGARVFLKEDLTKDHFAALPVVIVGIDSDYDSFTVERPNGETLQVSSQELVEINDRRMIAHFVPSQLMLKDYQKGKRFIATDRIKYHAFLNGNFQEGDVIEVIEVNTAECNYLEDSLVVGRTGFQTTVTVYDLKNYFKPYEGMVKKATGKVVGTVSKSDEEILLVDEPIVEPKKESKISIHELSIGDYRFKFIFKDRFNVESTIKLSEIDNFIEALQEFKEFMKREL